MNYTWVKVSQLSTTHNDFFVNTPFSLEMPVPSQGNYGFHSFPVVDWFCLFI
jgi:hypothetical protein